MIARVLSNIAVIIFWLIVFCLGAFINTNPMRQEIQNNFNLADFFLIILAWIPTNIAFLSILAGLLGALNRSLLVSMEQLPEAEQASKKKKNRLLGGAVAGFIFYMGFIAVAFVITDDPFGSTTEEQYYRIAGAISFISFVAGFRPNLLRRIFEKIPGF
ncbi:MAG: hypothetical protein KDC61_21495 [Saprospiraceae bacterium]|nr:hypothetical protein [Saprospiraceae bacterium]MCB0543469.1 hypothetical protein [Saprospiraceae bacterium]MCB0577148.1 hypothetical protein [Saprospiraceae bacterium]MCB9307615.1 hypothetical protein [Lewinellaceae bacterium]MCB9354517.1 hypothetical protein [Lewinellaceae bacterium]